jgi:hypothetical protein
MSLATPTRLRWYPRLLGAAALAGFLIVVSRGSGASDGRGGVIGGDYLAFYTAGRILAAGPVDDLYSYRRQGREQAPMLGEKGKTGFLPFVYPPFVALPFVPLGVLPYRASYIVYTLLMSAAVVAGARRLRSALPALDRWGDFAAVAMFGFLPLFIPIVGGQNTPVGFLCASAALAALADKRDFRAGLWLGAWLFKPHFALPAIGLCLVGRRFRALAGVAVVAAAYYAAAAAIAGAGWPAWWWRHIASEFVSAEFTRNADNLASWIGFSQAYLGAHTSAANLVGGGLALATIVWLVWVWWTRARDRAAECVAAAVAGALLISPHTMWYDVGLAALPLAVVAALGTTRERWAVAALWLLALVVTLPRPMFAIHPLFFVNVGTLALIAVRIHGGPRTSAGLAPSP